MDTSNSVSLCCKISDVPAAGTESETVSHQTPYNTGTDVDTGNTVYRYCIGTGAKSQTGTYPFNTGMLTYRYRQ